MCILKYIWLRYWGQIWATLSAVLFQLCNLICISCISLPPVFLISISAVVGSENSFFLRCMEFPTCHAIYLNFHCSRLKIISTPSVWFGFAVCFIAVLGCCQWNKFENNDCDTHGQLWWFLLECLSQACNCCGIYTKLRALFIIL